MMNIIFPVLVLLGIANAAIWKPKPMTTWQWQLTGAINTSYNVAMYDIDLFDTPQSVIDKLHRDGRIVICYFSAGTWEDWRMDKANFSKAVKGKEMGDWPGEYWFDVRNDALKAPIRWRLELAKKKKCDGVEPDNVDSYLATSGFPIKSADQLAFNKWLAAEAHKLELSIGLKNDIPHLKDLVGDFDWALSEQCGYYKTCGDYAKTFIAKGKAVFGVEYEGSPYEFCPQMNANKYSWLKKNHDDLDHRCVDCQDRNTWNVNVD